MMPGRVAAIRPGLIVGPGDGSDRFTYWPVRVSRGGEVLAPGTPDDPVQYIDVRDLADWTVRVVEARTVGVYNATGPDKPLPIGRLLESCRKVSGSDARFTWADADFLAAQKVEAWSDMPVWVPPTGETAGFARVDCSRATSRGLTFRPLDTTVRDTLSWWKEQPAERTKALRAGISPEREAEVLRAFRERKAAS
jgi:2'-hydroxyisoflavone reductase